MSQRVESETGGHAYSDVVQVFEPNALRLPPLREYVADLLRHRTFLVELAGAEVRGQRSSTFLGELWSLIDPIFQAAIYFFLFTAIRGGTGGTRVVEYATTIIGSVFFFNFTRISISDGGRSILRHRGLVLNAVFPRALLTLAEVYKGFLATVPAVLLYAILHVVVQAPLTTAIFIFPLLVLVQAVANLGLAFLFSTATTYFPDVSNLLSYVLRVLTFATPVIYPVSNLPDGIRAALSWNPLFALFAAYQAVITGEMPSAGLIIQSVFWALLLFLGGAWVFLRHERSFALHV